MAKIFVTGGTGRLGRYVVRSLLKNGFKVAVLSRRKENAIKGCEMVYGDMFDFDYMKIKGCKWAVHLAAAINFSAAYSALYNTNVEGTKSVIEHCEQAGIERLLYMSSIAVYGKRDNTNITEAAPLNPDTPYAKSKFEAEMLTKNFTGSVCILRPSIIYGPGFDEGFKFVYKMIGKGKMPIIGDGKNHIPLVHAQDVSNAIVLALQRSAMGVYNIGNDFELMQEQLLRYVAFLTGSPAPKRHIPKFIAKFLLPIYNLNRPQPIPAEYFDMLSADRIVNISKAKYKLGYTSSINLKEGIRDFVKYLGDSSGPAPD